MADLWYVLAGALLAGYVVLDGFDLGAAAVNRLVARDEAERGEVIAAIGPYWDGNEVFLLGAGGTLFVAFSRALASALSGMYLAVMLVLWGLLLRGIAIELRGQLADGVWRAAWDTVLQLASAGLALVLGVAVGDVIRGFPLDARGDFALELFSTASPRLGLGVIDAYTLATGVFGLAVLASHGARFLALRAQGPVQARAASLAERAALPVAALWAAVTALTGVFARPALDAFSARPAAWVVAAATAASLVASWWRGRKGDARGAFLASSAFVLGLVALAGASVYPAILRSVTPDVPSMTAQAAASDPASLEAGATWWFLAAALVVSYFVNLVRVHEGRHR